MLKKLVHKENRISLLFIIATFFVGSITHADSVKLIDQRNSARSFIKITDSKLRMNFRNRDTKNPMGTLGKGSILQFPKGVTVLDSKGQIDFAKTIEQWKNVPKKDAQGNINPIAINSSKKCGGQLCFPVKVISSSTKKIKPGSRTAIGYIALEYMNKKIKKSRYKTLRKKISEVITTNDEVPTPADTNQSSGGGEVTNNNNVTTPTFRPPGKPPKKPSDRKGPGASGTKNIFNCNNTRYVKGTRNFSRTNCLTKKGLSTKQKAELVMRDVLQINKLRPQFRLDPRYSACIAFRESGIAPNAKGGAGEAGMYQIIRSTHRDVRGRARVRSVTPGFKGKSADQERNLMIRSTLAQADIHHATLMLKAKSAKTVRAASNSSSDNVYYNLSVRYNAYNKTIKCRGYGRMKGKYCYAKKVGACFRCMKGLYNRNAGKKGNVSSNKVKNCLQKAGH